jgi:DNA-binding HxlR family transcriptional regulator
MLRTEKQRKELCTECPVAKVADIIGDPCSLLILRDLLESPRRFGHLDESLGMSTRTLTKTLLRLTHSGFIRRKEYKSLPPRVEYSLTKKGAALERVIEEMRKYGKKYL